MINIITPLLEDILKKYKESELSHGNNPLKLDSRIIMKLLEGNGNITYKTAENWTKILNEYMQQTRTIDEYFFVSELRWYRRERKVDIEYGDDPMNTDEWVSVVHFVLTKKFRGFGIFDILLFLFIFGLVMLFILKLLEY